MRISPIAISAQDRVPPKPWVFDCVVRPRSLHVRGVGGLGPSTAPFQLGLVSRAQDPVDHGPPLARWAGGVETPAAKLARIEKELCARQAGMAGATGHRAERSHRSNRGGVGARRVCEVQAVLALRLRVPRTFSSRTSRWKYEGCPGMAAWSAAGVCLQALLGHAAMDGDASLREKASRVGRTDP